MSPLVYVMGTIFGGSVATFAGTALSGVTLRETSSGHTSHDPFIHTPANNYNVVEVGVTAAAGITLAGVRLKGIWRPPFHFLSRLD